MNIFFNVLKIIFIAVGLVTIAVYINNYIKGYKRSYPDRVVYFGPSYFVIHELNDALLESISIPDGYEIIQEKKWLLTKLLQDEILENYISIYNIRSKGSYTEYIYLHDKVNKRNVWYSINLFPGKIDYLSSLIAGESEYSIKLSSNNNNNKFTVEHKGNKIFEMSHDKTNDTNLVNPKLIIDERYLINQISDYSKYGREISVNLYPYYKYYDVTNSCNISNDVYHDGLKHIIYIPETIMYYRDFAPIDESRY